MALPLYISISNAAFTATNQFRAVFAKLSTRTKKPGTETPAADYDPRQLRARPIARLIPQPVDRTQRAVNPPPNNVGGTGCRET